MLLEVVSVSDTYTFLYDGDRIYLGNRKPQDHNCSSIPVKGGIPTCLIAIGKGVPPLDAVWNRR